MVKFEDKILLYKESLHLSKKPFYSIAVHYLNLTCSCIFIKAGNSGLLCYKSTFPQNKNYGFGINPLDRKYNRKRMNY